MHEPTAPELQTDEALPALFDEGTQVGEAARTYGSCGSWRRRRPSRYADDSDKLARFYESLAVLSRATRVPARAAAPGAVKATDFSRFRWATDVRVGREIPSVGM